METFGGASLTWIDRKNSSHTRSRNHSCSSNRRRGRHLFVVVIVVVLVVVVILHAKLSGTVYCNRCCLWVCGFVCLFVDLLPR